MTDATATDATTAPPKAKGGGGAVAMLGAIGAVAGIAHLEGAVFAGIAAGTFVFFAGMFSAIGSRIRP
jgi:hypothetical protein